MKVNEFIKQLNLTANPDDDIMFVADMLGNEFQFSPECRVGYGVTFVELIDKSGDNVAIALKIERDTVKRLKTEVLHVFAQEE
jgi:hypothetical protein